MHPPTTAEIDEFVAYVLAFYTRDDWPKDAGCPPTEAEVRTATAVVVEHYAEVDEWHPMGPLDEPGYDLTSHCREVVRDLILLRRGYLGRTWPEATAAACRSTHRLEWGDLIARLSVAGTAS